MRVTQGTFSFLPDLTDKQIKAQIQYALDQGWALNVEYTDDPHPRNTYWEMWCVPMFDTKDAAAVLLEVNECRKVYGNMYIKVNSFDNSRWRESQSMSFIVNRPKEEPGFGVARDAGPGRS
ncbi:MAG: ribulose bisphosphate carboxylase small subunit, partial [Proteobacteria bacterium]|nr:ribulose bisphosphate carboxylase small subunit [Pseudomonadota bacterium]